MPFAFVVIFTRFGLCHNKPGEDRHSCLSPGCPTALLWVSTICHSGLDPESSVLHSRQDWNNVIPGGFTCAVSPAATSSQAVAPAASTGTRRHIRIGRVVCFWTTRSDQAWAYPIPVIGVAPDPDHTAATPRLHCRLASMRTNR